MFRPIRALMRLTILIVCGLLFIGLTAGGSALASTATLSSRLAFHHETAPGIAGSTTACAATSATPGSIAPDSVTPTTGTATTTPGTGTPAAEVSPTAGGTTEASPTAATSTETPVAATPSETEATATAVTIEATRTAAATTTEPGIAPLPTPIATEGSTPTATASPTPEATQANSATQAYTGDGYSISYPQGWNVARSTDQVVFTNATNTVGVAVAANNNPYGAANAQTALAKEVKQVQANLTNVRDFQLSATVQYAGVTWNQQGFEGDTKWGCMTYEVLTTNHPTNSANSKMYEIVYFAPTDQYEQDKTTYIRPMLESFVFTV